MPDMLVNLLHLPPLDPLLHDLRTKNITIRRAHPFEQSPIYTFIEKNFARAWADETTVAYANKPVSLFIATRASDAGSRLLGFAAHECTRRNYFGPMGVLESERNHGLGAALLLASLHALRDLGYAYAIIGAAGPAEFYANTVGATPIPNSTPGIYTDKLAQDQ
jgi:GNAT superfamily N-acetyltransferase